jgi:type I restriction enzyme S subunit
MKKYPKYKPSGVEWIGEIPENWEITKIKFLFQEHSGNGFPEDMQGKESGDIPFIKVSDLNKSGITVDSSKNYVSIKDAAIRKWNIVPENSILTAKIGEALKKNHRKINIVKCLIDNNCIALYPEKLNPKFAYYFLTTIDFDWFTNPGAVPSVSVDKLKNFKVVTTATIEEQAQIAAYLDYKTQQIDTLIANKEKLIELLQEERTAIINQAVTKGVNPNAKLKPSGIEWLGDIPENWEVKKLKYLINKIGDGLHGTPSYVDSSNYYFINGNNIGNGKINLKVNPKCVSEEEYLANKKSLSNNTILMSINGTIGNLAFYNNELVMLGKSVAYIDCNGIVDKEFVYFFLESEAAKNYINQELSGSTIKNLSLYTIHNLSIPFTNIEEQKTIVKHIQTEQKRIDTIITKTEQEIELMKEHKTALISEVVTGKVDIREEVIEKV